MTKRTIIALVEHCYARKLISERMEQALGQSPAPVENSNDEHAVIVAAIKKRNAMVPKRRCASI
jgi:hypothetical protein